MEKVINRHKVLVLNNTWTAIGFTSVQRAVSLLYKTYGPNDEVRAKVITPPPIGFYEAFDWSDWTKIRPEEGEDALVTPSDIFKIPEVILLTKYDKLPNRSATFCRREIWKRDDYKCQYCGIKCQDDLTLDHVVPRSLGGETSWTNCTLACSGCNSQKADRVPLGYEAYGPVAVRSKHHKTWIGESPMRLLKVPVKPKTSSFQSKRPSNLKESWKHWLNKMYWEIPLENDMLEDDFLS